MPVLLLITENYHHEKKSTPQSIIKYMTGYTTFIYKHIYYIQKIVKTSEWHGNLIIAVISKFYKDETQSRSYLKIKIVDNDVISSH